MRSPQAPTFLKIWLEAQPPPPPPCRKGGGTHYVNVSVSWWVNLYIATKTLNCQSFEWRTEENVEFVSDKAAKAGTGFCIIPL